jgi:hypothetical protein
MPRFPESAFKAVTLPRSPQFSQPEDRSPMYVSNDELIAFLLINTWTLTSGKMLRRDVPPHELGEQELIDFWADDELWTTDSGPSEAQFLDITAQKGKIACELPGSPQTAL